jgi:dolichol-phosphate mannosyltransferase
MSPELAIIVPSFNERANVPVLVEKIRAALPGVDWEVIFVDDDSPDGTAEVVRALGRTDPRVRCLLRIGRRGLSSACIEGMASSGAPYLAVMDADLQHDESLLPAMLGLLRTESACDLVVGSRYVEGGSVGNWHAGRKLISRFATVAGQRLLRCEVSDPMSGFFMIRQEAFWGAARTLSGRGFKILLDLLASSPIPLRVRELPFQFRARLAGESKLDVMIALEFGFLILDKLIGWLIPVSFVVFVLVGAVGAMVHLSILGAFHLWWRADFWLSQSIATGCAMLMNFFFNNMFTYRDRRLRGRGIVEGLLLFIAVCSVGAVANVRVATSLYVQGVPWWLAGLLGAVLGAVWNYALSTHIVWRPRKSGRPKPPNAAAA